MSTTTLTRMILRHMLDVLHQQLECLLLLAIVVARRAIVVALAVLVHVRDDQRGHPCLWFLFSPKSYLRFYWKNFFLPLKKNDYLEMRENSRVVVAADEHAAAKEANLGLRVAREFALEHGH